VCALTAFDNYCAEFLAYILDRNPYFLKFDDGVSQTHLLNRVFEKCPLFLAPTKDEQIAISEVVTDMDTELAALEQRREKTRALKQGMMQELLTGRTRLL
jgi:type I restriction enzyme S subunit